MHSELTMQVGTSTVVHATMNPQAVATICGPLRPSGGSPVGGGRADYMGDALSKRANDGGSE